MKGYCVEGKRMDLSKGAATQWVLMWDLQQMYDALPTNHGKLIFAPNTV